ncbi:uncharacterized protein TNCV_3209871 [Trichonephila clavipes]|nr:uncharacterized protein TNCV_3209871 [Trichonephila clavipes]
MHAVSMQNTPDGHMKNPDMTSDSQHTGIGIVLFQIQFSLLVAWSPYSLLPFLCDQKEGFVVGHTLEQACKECVAGSLPTEVISLKRNFQYLSSQTSLVPIYQPTEWMKGRLDHSQPEDRILDL